MKGIRKFPFTISPVLVNSTSLELRINTISDGDKCDGIRACLRVFYGLCRASLRP